MIIVCLLLEPSVVCEGAAITYIPNASFDANAFGTVVLGSPIWLNAACPAPCFNPSIVALPDSMRERLPMRAKYAAAFRFTESQCYNLAIDWDPRRQLKGMKSFFMLLDNGFAPVARVVEGRGYVHNIGLHDVRLSRHGDIVLYTGMMYAHNRARWVLRRFDLSSWRENNHTASVWLNATGFVHPDLNQSHVKGMGKNLGIFWSGVMDEPIKLVYWLKAPHHVDVRRGLPPPPAAPHMETLPPLHVDGYEAHNNINPIPLDDPGLQLGVLHTHSEVMLPHVPGKIRQPHGTTKHGNTYIHYFFAFRTVPPYEVVAKSPPFCFSSAADARRCDAIQFITSIDRTRHDQLLVSYGINDCEAAVVKLAWRDVLNFTFGPLAAQVNLA